MEDTEQNQTGLIYIDSPGKLISKKKNNLNNIKFTPAKKKIFLQSLSNSWNLTAAAYKAGIDRTVIYSHLNQDPIFKAAFEKIKNGYIDSIEAAGFHVAQQATREGFNDRKLMLQAHRREIYAPKIDVEVDHTITITQAPGQLRNMIARALKADSEDTDFTSLDNNNHV